MQLSNIKIMKEENKREKQVMERFWKNSKTNPPKESDRYWCYVEEQGELGKSVFQWNCYYDKATNSWSDYFKPMNSTYWTEFLDSPE